MNSDMIEGSVMCSTELIENAVKYGAEKPDGSSVDFDLHATAEAVEIIVSNGYHDDHDLNNVMKHIDKIKSSDDPELFGDLRLGELFRGSATLPVDGIKDAIFKDLHGISAVMTLPW